MTRRIKNIRYLIILGILSISAIILLKTGYSTKKSDVDENAFMVADTASVDKVEIKGKSLQNVLEKADGKWQVNRKYGMDPSMSKVLLAVLHEVRIKRKVPRKMVNGIIENLNTNGYQVSVYNGPDLILAFKAGGNGLSVSYFMGENGNPFVVHLPGYDSYVSGIFEVSENDWRDRLVLSTSWIGLKKFSLNYNEEKDKGFTISSKGSLPFVEGIEKQDTSKMMNYIEQFQYFAVDQFIDSGKNPRFDSLSRTIPWVNISIEAVSVQNPVVIKFFKKNTYDPLILGLINDSQLALFSFERIKEVFKNRNYFIKK